MEPLYRGILDENGEITKRDGESRELGTAKDYADDKDKYLNEAEKSGKINLSNTGLLQKDRKHR